MHFVFRPLHPPRYLLIDFLYRGWFETFKRPFLDYDSYLVNFPLNPSYNGQLSNKAFDWIVQNTASLQYFYIIGKLNNLSLLF